MRKHYERILHDSESRVQRYLDIQILDENSPFCGGFPKADSLAEPKTAIYRATTMTACYLNPESRYYLDAELGRRLALALAFVRRSQRPRGYFDLINCNFFSGPDTAFCTKRLLPAYVYLCKVVDGALPAAPEAKAAAAELKPKYEAIIRDAADALCHCGFHTPNHRWAIASVLMLCAKLFDKPECRSGVKKAGFEGGQMPLQRRLPKRGFNNIFATKYVTIKVSDLEKFEAGATVDTEALLKAGIISKTLDGVKVLGNGELTKALNVKVAAYTASAKEKIEKAGGKAEVM